MSADDKSVSEELDLRIIDQESLEREAQKVAEAEKLVEKKEKAEKALAKKTPKSDELKTPIGTPASAESIAGQKKDEEKDKDEAEEKKAEARLEKVEETIEKIDPIVGELAGIVQNPIGFLLGKITRGPVLFKLLGAMLGLKVAFDIILGVIEQMFQPGGVADIRVKVRNEVKLFAELDKLVDIRAGRVFFLADTRLTQSAVGRGSTSELSNEMNRFRELNIGGDLFTG